VLGRRVSHSILFGELHSWLFRTSVEKVIKSQIFTGVCYK
jgi:hypothetical protein